ncbi:MAG TPA: hypothetical protein VFN03_06870 [Trueperaceae bacterium]|nr:hypothetical protein [Trueperaceae bacterium]
MTTANRISTSFASVRRQGLGTIARRALVGPLVALALAACGSAPSIVVTLDSADATLVRGGEVQVVVTLTRSGGASADVTLSVTGLPANVDASFSPATLSGGTLASVLTLGAQPAAVAGTYDLVVSGAGSGLADTADLMIDVVSLSVTGRVVSLYDLPVAGVSVGSQGDTEVTGANGEFELTGLSVPYDVSVWNTAEEWVHIYEDLTSEELLLAPIPSSAPAGTARSAMVSGNLSGGVIPVAPNQLVFVCVEGVDGVALGCDTVAPTESSYSVDVQWLGSTTREVRLHALQAERDMNGYPIAYQGYANLAMMLTDTVPTVANLNLGGALATTAVSVEVDSPVAIAATLGTVQIGAAMALPVMLASSASISHVALMPVIAGATYGFAAAANISQFGWVADVTDGPVTVTVPALPQLVAPADLTTGVTTATNFVASNPTGGPITYVWTADVGDLQIAVTTMSSPHTIPDISGYGLALPPGADFSWQVLGHSGTSTAAGTHAIGDYYRFVMLISSSSQGLVGEGTFALSTDNWEFTTAP